MQRRSFLRAGTAGAIGTVLGGSGLLSWSPRAQAATVSHTYYITDGLIPQPDGVSVYFRGFSDSSGGLQVPAQPIIAREGDTIRVTVVNTLSQSHRFTIDGVVSSSVSGGTTRVVQFSAPSAGSYLFYDSTSEPYNRLLGLHGALAVMPASRDDELYAGSRRFDQQYFWILNDIDPAWHDRLRQNRTPSTPFVPRYFTINGRSGRPPGAPGNGDPDIDAMHAHDTALHGQVGDRTLIRLFNAGLAAHSVHWHANHVEWLTQNGVPRPDVWEKDIIYMRNNRGTNDVIFPFDRPPDAWPPVTTGAYPMHLHDEMTQTAGGGLYMFGAMTDIYFE